MDSKLGSLIILKIKALGRSGVTFRFLLPGLRYCSITKMPHCRTAHAAGLCAAQKASKLSKQCSMTHTDYMSTTLAMF